MIYIVLSLIVSNIFILKIYEIHKKYNFLKLYLNSLKNIITRKDNKKEVKSVLDNLSISGIKLLFIFILLISPYILIYILCISNNLSVITSLLLPTLSYLLVVKKFN